MKGQAALEYIVTYGWGFIAILVVLGGLAYFGFLSPMKYLPARCDLGSQLECVDMRLGMAEEGVHNGWICLRFRNNFGDGVRVVEMKTLDPGGVWVKDSWDAVADEYVGMGAYHYIRTGNSSTLLRSRIPQNNEFRLEKGDRVSLPVVITFQRDDPLGPPHNVTGEISATVADDDCIPT